MMEYRQQEWKKVQEKILDANAVQALTDALKHGLRN
jgi:hypothetical protein